jgi:hypothetical protein
MISPDVGFRFTIKSDTDCIVSYLKRLLKQMLFNLALDLIL